MQLFTFLSVFPAESLTAEELNHTFTHHQIFLIIYASPQSILEILQSNACSRYFFSVPKKKKKEEEELIKSSLDKTKFFSVLGHVELKENGIADAAAK